MADDNNKRLPVDEYYEVEHFARENGISPSQVGRLIKKNGDDRSALTKAARALRERKKRYRTNNEATGFRGKDHDQPIKSEVEHFEHCPVCGQDFDMRDLGQVLHHAKSEHQPLQPVN